MNTIGDAYKLSVMNLAEFLGHRWKLETEGS